MGDLIDTGEMYLKTVYELEEEGIIPLRARIAERLGHSGPTVSETVARLERDGMLHVAADRHIELTDQGRQISTDVMRKHRLAERLLLDVIGLEWPHVHEEACRWEHVMSDSVADRLESLLENVDTDPYGNPIPSEPLGPGHLKAADCGLIPLIDVLDDSGDGESFEVLLARIAEPLQVDTEILCDFDNLGIAAGSTITVTRHDKTVEISAESSGSMTMPLNFTKHLFIAR
ncbi:MAG: iron dependent repressor, metal binding and dimerization domain protein [Flaviflexus sp.]|nr:iron dependent repressor, metal binding and dimerization domain protein [Flaviflexus sp.]